MKSFFDSLFGKLSYAYKFLLFLLTIGLIIYFLPREGKFRYEFQKGEPWMHELLVAPFDFPIYKSEEELEQEKDSVLKEYDPYYRYEEAIQEANLAEFRGHFNEEWQEFIHKVDTLRISKSKKAIVSSLKDTCFKINNQLLKAVYEKGILDPGNLFLGKEGPDSTILVLKGNIAEKKNANDLYTPKSAYEHIISKQKEICQEGIFQDKELLKPLIKKLDINRFLVPNLNYDAATSKKVKESMLNGISMTRGMVQAGERIIMKGDVVNAEKYRILNSLRREYEKRLGNSTNFYLVIIGQFILVFSIILVLFLFIINFKRDILENATKTSFILLMVTLLIVITGLVVKFTNVNLYLIPFAVLPIIIWTFFDARLALFIHIVTILLAGFMAPNSFEFFMLNFISGIVAIFSLKNLYRRGKLFLTAGLVVISYCFVYFGINIIQEGDIRNINWENFAWFGGNGLLVLFSYPLIYMFEKLFGFLSDSTLMELSDTNQPLLRQLAEKAPGTFQHTLQVANLAEEAVISIGGNPLLVRAGALYHDVGKLGNPVYFTENQMSGYNPHDGLDYEESARLIINHIAEGVRIARKHKLPEPIIDFIRTHQGRTQAKYFYFSKKNESPEEEVDIEKFTYPGPTPFSKETAVLMMADSVEAASKSLKEINGKSINNLVDKIIDDLIDNGQFDNTDITFKDINKVKAIFKKKLLNIYHVRIEYPKENKKNKEDI